MSECVKTLFICVDVSVGQFCRVGWDDGMHIKHLPSSTSSLSFSIFVFGAQLSLHCPVLLPFRAWLRRSFHQIQRCGTWQIELSTLWKLMFHPSAVGWDGTHHRQGEVAQFDQFCAHGHCAGSKWLGHSTLVVSGPCFFFENSVKTSWWFYILCCLENVGIHMVIICLSWQGNQFANAEGKPQHIG